MADIDVSEVLFDPDLADMFDVVRKEETVNEQGRSTIKERRYQDIVGVITAQSPAELLRRDDGQMMPRKYAVVTVFRLQGPGKGYQPDDIWLDGQRFTVTEVLPYSRFGSGFVEAIITSMNASNPAP